MKNNIIQFPTERRQAQIEEEMEWEYENFTEECVDTAQFALLLLEDYIESDEASTLKELDFRDPEFAESRDMFVVVNLLSSMFMRYGGVTHFLQKDLETLFTKIQETKEHNDFT
jgi:hypothetical protein